MSISIICPQCGHHLQIRADDLRPEVECLLCGTLCPVPAAAPKKGAAKPPLGEAIRPASSAPRTRAEERPAPVETRIKADHSTRSPPPVAWPEAPPSCAEDEDGMPYDVVGGEERKCPDCNRTLAADAVVCAACGFDLQTGKKPRKVYEPVQRSWEAGLSLRRRLHLFALGQGVVLVSGLLIAWVTGSPALFLVPWLLFTALLAFVLGTYDRIDLSRNQRGKVFLSKTWRICFRTLPPTPIKVIEYEAVATGVYYETDFWDWILLLTLLGFGLLPGLFWFWYGMSQDTYFVALARDHGYPEVMLYRGWSRSHMEDIARTLREVAQMP
jgi:hypothetical protein